jgi:lipid-binding SYLF domain-containing protein
MTIVKRGQARPDAARDTTRRRMLAVVGAMLATASLIPQAAGAATASGLDAAGKAALARLYAKSARAQEFGKLSVGILVFPRIIKAGLLVGGMSGDGVLFEHGRPAGYYNLSGASYGLQAGGQTYAYALFFLKRSALDYIHKVDGWAIGSGPSVVVADKGIAEAGDTTTLTQDVYAVPFSAKGLMASLSLQGSKITPIHPKP